jgi:ubiquinol-cytochrome c reductase cytochrome b subunit
MQPTITLQRNQSNTIRDGYHVLSRYWQTFKIILPELTQYQKDVCIGMVLGDASITKQNTHASIKIEQGYIQQSLVIHLYDILASHCFMTAPGTRIESSTSSRAGKIKSYWFKTWAIPQFTILWELLYVNNIKTIQPGLILNYVSPVALAFWIICDGSRSGNVVTLHTQSFTWAENEIISRELNERYGLSSTVVVHKKKYSVVRFSSKDGPLLRKLVGSHILPSLQYKIP